MMMMKESLSCWSSVSCLLTDRRVGGAMMMTSHLRRTLCVARGRLGVGGCLPGGPAARPCSGGGGLSAAYEQGGGEGAGLILRSRSTDVYQNLALEDWIDANVDLRRRSVLLLWRNRPAVVIGRHQNPWSECDLRAMRAAGVPLARRRSGGGTVFHDLGNLNLTFFTCKKKYDRKRNLRVVTDALRTLRPGLDVHATDRYDIILNGHYKISGTASRLGRSSAYHHCTLLFSADRSALSAVLRPTSRGVRSNATPSVPSPVTNLLDHDPTLDWDQLLAALGAQYNSEFGFSAVETVVDPSDESAFPGVGGAAAELQSWDWLFGKTPKFSVDTRLELREEESGVRGSAHLQVEVKGGVMDSCRLGVSSGWLPAGLSGELSALLAGGRFCPEHTAAVAAAMLRSQPAELQGRLRSLCDAVIALM
ncbi:lipoyl amidotransferase LIPT1, mitochondrial isoform X2 [Myripristis murdjan]|uniref:lipoyl amidotransferase LIPT1, mitochondrial isoform X2 n=1 Tax=Myripristis murdjan TaxID=586833 RepID=UPI0011761DB9|nr:lipoyltransferase 1, mitochondrial isoform X2 [Myripristis murdjan]